MNLLDIKNLSLEMDTPHGKIRAIDKANLTLKEGEIHGLMGESGSGKSLIAKTIIGVTNPRWKITADRLYWNQQDLLALSAIDRRTIMSKEMAFVPQDASSSLDPTATIGSQILEICQVKAQQKKQKRQEQDKFITQLLHQVGISDHDYCLNAYPNELTDDVCQKITIALALAEQPKLLIADEPCSQMSAIAQQNIFKLLYKHNVLNSLSILVISHDIAMLSKFTNSLTVMYCGQTVESGNSQKVYANPQHPYTHTLVKTNITLDNDLPFKSELPTLKGTIPTLQHLPIGCRLGPRCPNAQKDCVKIPPVRKRLGQIVSCHHPMDNKAEKAQ